MAAGRRERWRPWRRLTGPAETEESEAQPFQGVGRRLGEPGKFAYAALCAISLASLFPEQEEALYRTQVVEDLVTWLELSDAVLPAMLALAGGLGGEGAETFARILLKEPLLEENPAVITQDLVSFSLKDGYYDARARVLLSHLMRLLEIPLQELEASEADLLEHLNEEKEEESDLQMVGKLSQDSGGLEEEEGEEETAEAILPHRPGHRWRRDCDRSDRGPGCPPGGRRSRHGHR